MAQHWAVNVHLKDKWRSVKDDDAHILDREDRWFERGLKEVIYVNNSHWTEGMLYNTKRPCNNGKKTPNNQMTPYEGALGVSKKENLSFNNFKSQQNQDQGRAGICRKGLGMRGGKQDNRQTVEDSRD